MYAKRGREHAPASSSRRAPSRLELYPGHHPSCCTLQASAHFVANWPHVLLPTPDAHAQTRPFTRRREQLLDCCSVHTRESGQTCRTSPRGVCEDHTIVALLFNVQHNRVEQHNSGVEHSGGALPPPFPHHLFEHLEWLRAVCVCRMTADLNLEGFIVKPVSLARRR